MGELGLYDLPYSANTDEIRVKHLYFRLKPCFEKRICFGQILFHLRQLEADDYADECSMDKADGVSSFSLRLDLYCLKIQRVFGFFEELKSFDNFDDFKPIPMKWSADEWCLKVWHEDYPSIDAFPLCIYVQYETESHGPSLLWTDDQCGNKCCLTTPSSVNNRSMMPGQDHPFSISTWEGEVDVPAGYTGILGGEWVQTDQYDWGQRFKYRSELAMPVCTLCLAVGKWSEETLCEAQRDTNPSTTVINGTRIHSSFSLPKVILLGCENEFVSYRQLLSQFLISSLETSISIFGLLPFSQVRVVIAPPCFPSLGFTSPYLVFLSPDLLHKSGSMLRHVSHELGHLWFGVLIGERRWNEPWMSESFAEFVGEIVDRRMSQMSQDLIELRLFLRWHSLQEEMEHTEAEFQVLSTDSCTSGCMEALRPENKFILVHYLKGFLLLSHLCNLIDESDFLRFMRHYVEKFSGCLVASEDFIESFRSFFATKELAISNSIQWEQWLRSPGMPEPIRQYSCREDNILYNDVLQKFRHSLKFYRTRKRSHPSSNPLPLLFSEFFQQFVPEQKKLMLNLSLQEKSMPRRFLDALHPQCSETLVDVEVEHLWLELAVKSKYSPAYSQVIEFLDRHKAMGVYLYGEVMIHSDPELVQLIRDQFERRNDQMDKDTYQLVHSMLWGNE